MPIYDIHTHGADADPFSAIRNIVPFRSVTPREAYFSVGIHPWYIDMARMEEQWEEVVMLARRSNCLAVGEAGLDTLCDTPIGLQEIVFERHIALSEQLHKPLVIHCVRTAAQIIAAKKKFKPSMPWIIHGFRGKKEMAKQMCAQGFYLSFGLHYHADAMVAVPITSILMETDEAAIDIKELYQRAADIKQLPLADFMKAMVLNSSLFVVSSPKVS